MSSQTFPIEFMGMQVRRVEVDASNGCRGCVGEFLPKSYCLRLPPCYGRDRTAIYEEVA